MSTYQNTNITLPIASANPLRMVVSAWNETASKLKTWHEAARHERIVAGLPAHLRQDIGEIDCRPSAPQPLPEKLRSEPQTLETMWLRHR